MNNYQKLTLESFVEKLKAKEFKGIAGARRSIGKAQISKADREKAHLAINKFFGAEGAGPKKAAAKKAVKASPPKAAKKAATPKAAPKVAKKVSVKANSHAHLSVRAQETAVAAPTGDERAVRANAAATIIGAMYGRAPIEKDLEKKILEQAGLEYLANVGVIGSRADEVDSTPPVKSHERIARPRVPVHKPAATKAVPAPAPVETKETPALAAPENDESLPPPPFDENNCTPEQRRQYELLRDSKEHHSRDLPSS